MKRHNKICVANSNILLKKDNDASQAQSFLKSKMVDNVFLKKERLNSKILNTIRADRIGLTVKFDLLICSFGKFYVKRHKQENLSKVTKNKLRELARLLIEARTVVYNLSEIQQIELRKFLGHT